MFLVLNLSFDKPARGKMPLYSTQYWYRCCLPSSTSLISGSAVNFGLSLPLTYACSKSGVEMCFD